MIEVTTLTGLDPKEIRYNHVESLVRASYDKQDNPKSAEIWIGYHQEMVDIFYSEEFYIHSITEERPYVVLDTPPRLEDINSGGTIGRLKGIPVRVMSSMESGTICGIVS